MSDEVNPMYENRLLVFLEDIDRGVFNQVLLSQTQFKKVSDAIVAQEWDDPELKEGFKMARTRMSGRDIPADVFIGAESITKLEDLLDADKSKEDRGDQTDYPVNTW